MPPALSLTEEDPYNSASDSDFNASLSPSSGDESEASDAPTATASTLKRDNRKTYADGDVDMASGDEGVVAQARKKRRRKGKGKEGEGEGDGEGGEDEDGEGGVGIRVRLRSGRGGYVAFTISNLLQLLGL